MQLQSWRLPDRIRERRLRRQSTPLARLQRERALVQIRYPEVEPKAALLAEPHLPQIRQLSGRLPALRLRVIRTLAR